MKLEFKFEGEKLISRNFRILADDITDMSSEFRAVWKRLIQWVNDNFKQEWTQTGKWQNLASSTEMARSRKWGYYKRAANAPQILRWTGQLQNWFFAENWKLESRVSNNVPYFQYHQTRFWARLNLPRRIMLDISTKTQLDVTNILAKGINKRVWNFGRQL